jgi:hypothetical protein
VFWSVAGLSCNDANDMFLLWKIGGVEEDRTPDLRIANATLSQLSYHPEKKNHFT